MSVSYLTGRALVDALEAAGEGPSRRPPERGNEDSVLAEIASLFEGGETWEQSREELYARQQLLLELGAQGCALLRRLQAVCDCERCQMERRFEDAESRMRERRERQ